MKRRPWFDDDAEIRRRHADRMMYRPVNREPFPRPAPPEMRVARVGGAPEVSAALVRGAIDAAIAESIPPEVDRSVHMRPAETEHPPAEARRRDRAREWAGEVGAVAGELVGELVGWLLRRLL